MFILLLINKIIHPCHTHAIELKQNDLNSSLYEVELNTDLTIVSTSQCITEEQNVRWFTFQPMDISFVVDLCDSTYASDLSLQVISFPLNSNGTYHNESCSSSNAICKQYVTNNCENNSLYSRLYIQSKSNEKLFIGVTSSLEKVDGIISMKIRKGCQNDCGQHGFCNNEEGYCLCEKGYIENEGICTLCGNGVLDEGEECDNSIENDYDPFCDELTCKCQKGYHMINRKILPMR